VNEGIPNALARFGAQLSNSTNLRNGLLTAALGEASQILKLVRQRAIKLLGTQIHVAAARVAEHFHHRLGNALHQAEMGPVAVD